MCVFSEWNKVLSLNSFIHLIMYKPGIYMLVSEGRSGCLLEGQEAMARQKGPGHSGWSESASLSGGPEWQKLA